MLVKIRELLAAVPSTSASLSAILQSLLCAFSPHKAGLTGNPAKNARGPEFVVRYAPAGLQRTGPALRSPLADLVNERLIFEVPFSLLHQPLGLRLALVGG